VSSVYVEGTGVQPLAGLTSVRQKGGIPGTPPVIPVPESLAAQGPYVRLLRRLRGLQGLPTRGGRL